MKYSTLSLLVFLDYSSAHLAFGTATFYTVKVWPDGRFEVGLYSKEADAYLPLASPRACRRVLAAALFPINRANVLAGGEWSRIA